MHDQLLVTAELANQRLDKALQLLLPGSSLRYRRKLCSSGLVQVEGKSRKSSYKLSAGQKIVLLQQSSPSSPSENKRLLVVARKEQFAALYKPAGLHCQKQALSSSLSVEEYLPDLFSMQTVILLNRLDHQTTGLVLVAFSAAARHDYLQAQENGLVNKYYLACIQGRLKEDVWLKTGIDTANRKKVKVLKQSTPDALRWTFIRPIADLGHEKTLVLAKILKGKRHQIRAHAASIGHAIVGDALYGREAGEGLFLHHLKIDFPGFEAFVLPGWACLQQEEQGQRATRLQELIVRAVQ